jgi:hypothetical protein
MTKELTTKRKTKKAASPGDKAPRAKKPCAIPATSRAPRKRAVEAPPQPIGGHPRGSPAALLEMEGLLSEEQGEALDETLRRMHEEG